MGKPTGFMEFQRKENPMRSVQERIGDFSELHAEPNLKARQQQAARCMNCGVPFCQSGEKFGGMFSGCPLHNLIPEWNDEIYQGNWKHALARLTKTNNFPEFTGRVCPALCEAACTCGMNGDAVTVHDNELAIIEEGFAKGYVTPKVPAVRSGKKVAVIGSGPAGFAVADQLNHRGHSVTVYEKSSKPGGLLMFGIPNMKLDKQIVMRRIHLMEAEGITFVTDCAVGRDVSAEELLSRYDAVILCCGAGTPRDLQMPGREAAGIHFALDYLTDATKAVIGEKPQPDISAKDLHVVIIGGGDTGNDCVATAIRQGCCSVTQLEMMPKPPACRLPSNPWPQWPKVLKTDYGQQEAIAAFGSDPRRWQTTVKEVLQNDDGRIRAVITQTLERDASGRMIPVAGSEQELPCDLLLIAAGFTGITADVPAAFSLETDECGNLKSTSHKTTQEKVFTAGDCRRGQSLVVWAIAEGRECAREVDEFLTGC